MDAEDRLRSLVALAGLAPVTGCRTLADQGTDNVILAATLADGRQVLFRARRHGRERLRAVIMVRADPIRADVPRLCHGDLNLDNVIVGDDGTATLIDWDHPAVRYPLEELSAFDEHVFLAGGRPGLPDAFFAGYGRDVPRDVLLLERIVGCLGWLSSDDWATFAADPVLTPATKAKFAGWHERLLTWSDDLPDHLDELDAHAGAR